jgi:hypothetical protein
MHPVRILVLEEDPQWRQALSAMYERVLGQRGQVLHAADAASAERQLRREPVDVLSLDLNLSEKRSESDDANAPLMCDTQRLQLVDLASKRRWTKAVVLITKPEADGQSRFIACDEEKLNEAVVSPDEFLRRRFADRGLVLNKPPRWDLPMSLGHFEDLIRRRLPDLAGGGYVLRFGGTDYEPRATIEAAGKPIAALEGRDALLLYALAKLKPDGEFLSDQSALRIYRGGDDHEGVSTTPLAQREVDSFRRRLTKHGVNHHALIRRVRKDATSPSGAWRLDGSVLVHGLASVNVRARGGTDLRHDIVAPHDE